MRTHPTALTMLISEVQDLKTTICEIKEENIIHTNGLWDNAWSSHWGNYIMHMCTGGQLVCHGSLE